MNAHPPQPRMKPLTAEEIERIAQRRARAKLGWYTHAVVYVLVNLFIFAISRYGFGSRPWSIFPLLGWGLGLALHGVAVFVLGAGGGLRERLVQQERERLQRQQAAPDGPPAMKIDWIDKLRHLLQALAFCLAIATIQYGFAPERPYAAGRWSTSLCIGIIIWAVIDLGRHLFPSAPETGWPQGLQRAGAGGRRHRGGLPARQLAGRPAVPHLRLVRPGQRRHREPTCARSVLITVLAGVVGSYYFYSLNRSAYLERKMGEARQHANEARLQAAGNAARAAHAVQHAGQPARADRRATRRARRACSTT